MMPRFILSVAVALLSTTLVYAQPHSQLDAVRTIIEAVNTKDPILYVSVFAEDAKVYVDDDLKVDGKPALLANRTKHLQAYPGARSDIQHLVEIDHRVVMHDWVWLSGSDRRPYDIVEIFTFREGKIIRVDVIQPVALFRGE